VKKTSPNHYHRVFNFAENYSVIALFPIISDKLFFFCHDHRHEAELVAAAAQPLPDDDDDLIE